MTRTAALWAHMQTALLLLTAACLLLPVRWRTSFRFRVGAPLLAVAAAYVPLAGLDLTGHVYAYSGTLSVTSLALLAALAARRMAAGEFLGRVERRCILIAALALTLLLYPMALGIGGFDPYAAGYSSAAFPVALVALAVLAMWRGHRPTAWLAALVLWAWLLKLGESPNAWDYALDAWLGLFALLWGARSLLHLFLQRARTGRAAQT